MKTAETIPDFDGAAIHIPGQVIERWRKAYLNIRDWPAALKAVDDLCASYPADDPAKLSKASLWLEQRNHENRNDSEHAIKMRGRSF